MSNNVVTLKSG